ncbi:MAG TPA: 3-oxoacyl-[acyl-carrier-protein] synthase III C-terminal domain-containing protein [Trebonia sp.]|jgi:alkylresorcinol/alkylpyrone synthase
MSRIRAVRSAFPPHRYPQDEVTRAVIAIAESSGELRPSQRALLERLYASAGVAARHTVLPIGEYESTTRLRDPADPDTGADRVNDRYIGEATALGERALRAALADAGVAAGDLDLLIVTSVTGVAVPSLDALLIPRLGLRPDIKRLPVFGLGCVAGAAGLARLHDYLLGWPGHTAALLAVELCSLSLPRTAVTTADLVASALFGDGAAAVVAVGEQAPAGPRLPRVIATTSEVYPDSTDTLGWRLGADGFRIVLTAELADVVERRLNGSVTAFLAAHGLTIDDIGTWICHPGGPKVIDAAQRALKLPDRAVAASRRSLSEAGNMSSVSVLHILELIIDEDPPQPGSFGLMVGLGPGVSAELLLLRW